MIQALLAGADVLNYKSARAICWENIILHSHPEIEISFKFIPKILMSKECIHFFGPLCIYLPSNKVVLDKYICFILVYFLTQRGWRTLCAFNISIKYISFQFT